jgi:hypothetical protein
LFKRFGFQPTERSFHDDVAGEMSILILDAHDETRLGNGLLEVFRENPPPAK